MSSKLKLEEAKKYLLVDKHNLEIECERYSSVFWEIADAAAEAASDRDYLKDEAEKIWAEIWVANKLGGEKLSDPTVKSMTDSDKKYTVAYSKFLNAKEIALKWEGLKESYESKSMILRNLVEMNIKGGGNFDVAKKSEDLAYQETKRKMREK